MVGSSSSSHFTSIQRNTNGGTPLKSCDRQNCNINKRLMGGSSRKLWNQSKNDNMKPPPDNVLTERKNFVDIEQNKMNSVRVTGSEYSYNTNGENSNRKSSALPSLDEIISLSSSILRRGKHEKYLKRQVSECAIDLVKLAFEENST